MHAAAYRLQALTRDAAQNYKQVPALEVPPLPSAVKRAVMYVSDLAERTGMTLVVRNRPCAHACLRAHLVLPPRSRLSSASCRAEPTAG